MATTTNFGWTTPDDTDLVKDGAAAIRTLGSAIDTSLVDLKGGTTGQVLAKASGTDMDFTWATDASGIPATIFDAKGDLIAASAADTAARLAVGTDGQVLTADSTESTGLKWATPAGTLTIAQIASGTLTSGTELSLTSLSSYDTLELRVNALNVSVDALLSVKINSNTGSNYEYNSATDRATASHDANEPSNRFSLTDTKFDPMDAYQKSGNTTNHFRIRFTNCKNAGFTLVEGLFTYRYDQSGTARNAQASWKGIYKVAEAVSSIQFTTGSGAFVAGNYVLWGA